MRFSLDRFDQKVLSDRGVSPDVAEANGLYTCRDRDVMRGAMGRPLGFDGAAMVIPYLPRREGDPIDYCRLRPHWPNGHKYESPSGVKPRPYVPAKNRLETPDGGTPAPMTVLDLTMSSSPSRS